MSENMLNEFRRLSGLKLIKENEEDKTDRYSLTQDEIERNNKVLKHVGYNFENGWLRHRLAGRLANVASANNMFTKKNKLGEFEEDLALVRVVELAKLIRKSCRDYGSDGDKGDYRNLSLKKEILESVKKMYNLSKDIIDNDSVKYHSGKNVTDVVKRDAEYVYDVVINGERDMLYALKSGVASDEKMKSFMNQEFLDEDYLNENETPDESGIKFDLYESSVADNFKAELTDLLNRYLGMSNTDNFGTSNDNKMFVHKNLMDMVNNTFPADNMRMSNENDVYYTNRPEEMSEFLKINGVPYKDLKSVR